MSAAPEVTAQYVVVRDGKLRSTRLTLGLTQLELSERAGVSEPVVTHAEAGRPIRARSAYALAGALGEDVAVLFKDAA